MATTAATRIPSTFFTRTLLHRFWLFTRGRSFRHVLLFDPEERLAQGVRDGNLGGAIVVVGDDARAPRRGEGARALAHDRVFVEEAVLVPRRRARADVQRV